MATLSFMLDRRYTRNTRLGARQSPHVVSAVQSVRADVIARKLVDSNHSASRRRIP
jgi:hypothetical protein